ncbi:flavin monoamine oxidase family protein [Rhizobium etli]|uniref:Monoamine oxidase n=1 Tax=Rhizobium etli TaxID=29449 RepID=A0A7W7EE08_RHIET|nr:FAD-dependent oxidoreductase [Rhizobium etli]MBB4478488.1 monoamine oxidase [Rhizobium etli]MBB4534320.1 monoamine oxidase [Rhizobium etli]
MTLPVMIVGGGISGLTLAHAMQSAGIDFVLIEGRDRLGGRIFSAGIDGLPSEDGFDLGPSWVWPKMQPVLCSLAERLGIQLFPENDEGDIVFERSASIAPQRFPAFQREPRSMRIKGGTASVVAALKSRIAAEHIRLGTRVTGLARTGGSVSATLEGPGGTAETMEAAIVVLAMPPRLIDRSIKFEPPVDPSLARRWRSTPTWMAPHAKFFAIYEEAFWRRDGLSGAAQSMIGPLGEIHDATTSSGNAALFGFVGVTAAQRRRIGPEPIIQASVEQLVRLFGDKARTPVATLYKDWAADALTATEDDLIAAGHPLPDARPWVSGDWSPVLMLAGSETSITNPGYLEGAAEAALRVAADIERIWQGLPKRSASASTL